MACPCRGFACAFDCQANAEAPRRCAKGIFAYTKARCAKGIFVYAKARRAKNAVAFTKTRHEDACPETCRAESAALIDVKLGAGTKLFSLRRAQRRSNLHQVCMIP
jgi:hypothetical protein